MAREALTEPTKKQLAARKKLSDAAAKARKKGLIPFTKDYGKFIQKELKKK